MYKEGDKVLIEAVYVKERPYSSNKYRHCVRIERGSGLVYVTDDNICSVKELQERIRKEAKQ